MKLTSEWICGFTDGEGCFYIGINKNKTMKLKQQVLPEFVITQHKRDIKVLYAIKEFFKCGIVKKNKGDIMCYCVRNLKNLINIIIPFFEKNILKTIKKYNFLRFKWIVNVMINKQYHLTEEGLKKIKLVKDKMNKNTL